MQMRDLRISDLRLPDLRVPVLPRWAVLVVVVVIALAVTLTLNALKEAGSFDGTAASSSEQAAPDARDGTVIDPVAPLDPDDSDATRSTGSEEPVPDVTDPFGTGYGAEANHRVRVRVISTGLMGVGVKYRDKKGTKEELVYDSYETSRQVRGRLPIVAVTFQILSANGSGRCEIFIDGTKVASKSMKGLYNVQVCYA